MLKHRYFFLSDILLRRLKREKRARRQYEEKTPCAASAQNAHVKLEVPPHTNNNEKIHKTSPSPKGVHSFLFV